MLTFDRAVRTHDGRPIEGFWCANRRFRQAFHPARVEYLVVRTDARGRKRKDRKRLVVWSDLPPKPVAVRYAWARNPLGNLVNHAHFEGIITVPCFRSAARTQSSRPTLRGSIEVRVADRAATPRAFSRATTPRSRTPVLWDSRGRTQRCHRGRREPRRANWRSDSTKGQRQAGEFNATEEEVFDGKGSERWVRRR